MARISLRRTHLLIVVLLVVSTVAVYWPVREFEFLHYDDTLFVSENEHVTRGITSESIAWAFTTGHMGSWLPLTWLSHMLDYELFGLNAGAHHQVNLLLHAANAVLLYLVLFRMTGGPLRSAMVALLFALHPLHVESVAWIAERKDLLSTLFWLLTMGAYARYVDKPGAGRYVAALLLFVCGLASKPMLVTLPFVLLLLDFWPLDRIRAADVKSVLPLVREKIPFFALSALFSLIAMRTQRAFGAMDTTDAIPLATRLANAAVSYVVYMFDMVWPSGLAVYYPYDHDLSLTTGLLAALLLTLISVVALRVLHDRPYLAVGWFWYLGTLVPVIGLTQIGAQSHADRYTYIPLVGLFVALCWGVPALLPAGRHRRYLLAGTALLVGVACMATTSKQLMYWKDSKSLYSRALDVTEDNSRFHYNLGLILGREGRHEEALDHFRSAVRSERFPDSVWTAMGASLLRLDRPDEAIDAYREFLRLHPDHVQALRAVADVYLEQGRLEQAVTSLSDALSIDSGDAARWSEIGQLYARIGRPDDATHHLRRALEIDPQYAPAHENLAVVLMRLGRPREAAAEYAAALQTAPDSIVSLNSLAWLLATSENPAPGSAVDAVRLAEHAAELTDGNDAMVLFVLATAYRAADRPADALRAANGAAARATAAGQRELAERAAALERSLRDPHPRAD